MRIAPPRYETAQAILVAGVRRRHAFADAARSIPAQWAELGRLGPLPGEVGATRFGVVCATDPAAGEFEYLCGAEVVSFDGVAPGVGRVRIPGQRYAVFTHRGGAATLRDSWEAIWEAWLPASGLSPAHMPDFERYDPLRYDPSTDTGEIEIWFPLADG